MGLARATVALPAGPNPEDFEEPVSAGQFVNVPDDHPLIGSYLVPEAIAVEQNRDQLVAAAEALGIDVPTKATKPQIQAMIEEAQADEAIDASDGDGE